MFSKIKRMSSYKKCMHSILVTGTPDRLLCLGYQKIAANSQLDSIESEIAFSRRILFWCIREYPIEWF